VAKKVIELHVHKNTLAKRTRKVLKDQFLAEAKDVFIDEDIVAYAFVAIDKDQGVHTLSNQGKLRAAEFTLLVKDGMQEATLGSFVDAEAEENGSA